MHAYYICIRSFIFICMINDVCDQYYIPYYNYDRNYFYPVRVYDRTSYEAYHRLSTIIFQWRFHHFQSLAQWSDFWNFHFGSLLQFGWRLRILNRCSPTTRSEFPFFKFLNLLFCLKGLIIFIRRYVDRTTEKLKKKLVCLCLWKKFEIY